MLTTEQEELIILDVREGASIWSAIVSHGIPWKDWIETVSVFECAFYDRVEQAEAQARAQAEKKVIIEKPLEWLTKGPGKARKDRPGWGDRIEVTGAEAEPVAVEYDFDGIDRAKLREFVSTGKSARVSSKKPPKNKP